MMAKERLSLRLLCAALLCAVLGLGTWATPAYAKGEPVSNSPYDDAASVSLENGEYTVDVVLEGGTGRASVQSPAKLTVVDGKAAAAIEWSSPNYDYMVVAGKQYLPVNAAGNSIFQIPVVAFDEAFDVVGDTTAMSEPHEVDYTITFDFASIAEFDANAATGATSASSANSASSASASAASTSAAAGAPSADAGGSSSADGIPFPWMVFIICALLALLVAGIAIGIVRGNRNK